MKIHSYLHCAILMALLTVALVKAADTNRAAVPCDCWTGTRSADLSTCNCICPTGYLQPYCAWKAGEFTKINIVTNFVNITDFSGSYLGRQLRLRLGLDATSDELFFSIVEETGAIALTRAYTTVVGRFTIRGNISTTLFQNIHADPVSPGNWTTKLNITTVYPYYPDVALAVAIQGGKWFALSEGVDLHTYDILWVLFVFIVCIIACIDCCCCSTNTTAKAQAAQDEMTSAARQAALAGFAVSQGGGQIAHAWDPNAQVIHGIPVVVTSEGDGGNDAFQMKTATGGGNSPGSTNPLIEPTEQAEAMQLDDDLGGGGRGESPRKYHAEQNNPCVVPE